MGRKLKVPEIMCVSRILDDLNFKSYAEYLLSNKLDKILKSQDKIEIKMGMLIGDISAFVLQNMHKAESNISSLMMRYMNLSQDEINDMDVDLYTETLKEIFAAGIPNVIKNIVDVEELKKKTSSMISDQNTTS